MVRRHRRMAPPADRGARGSGASTLFFAVNLMNPLDGFGDVRLSLVFGFGLAWVSPMALVQASSTPTFWRP